MELQVTYVTALKLFKGALMFFSTVGRGVAHTHAHLIPPSLSVPTERIKLLEPSSAPVGLIGPLQRSYLPEAQQPILADFRVQVHRQGLSHGSC